MSHVGYFITIEGVENILATEVFTGAGSWSGRTFLSCFEKSGMSSFNYAIKPHKREADVGVISIQLVDQHGSGDAAAGVLTDLFAVRKSQPRLYLKDTIEQGDTMTGAGTVEVTGSLNAVSFPTHFYIERETFYSATQGAEKVFGGVSRASSSSRKARHIGYNDDTGYNPEVHLSVPSWKDRMAHVYRVVDEDVANATRWWSGSILDLSPAGVNTWSLRIGSVIRLLEKTIFDKPNMKLSSDINEPAELRSPPDWMPEDTVLALPLDTEFDVIRTDLTCSSTSTIDADGLRAYTYCTDLNEPDGFWNSQHWGRMLTGIYGPSFMYNSEWPNIDFIPFTEAASPTTLLSATITSGTYSTDTLATEIAAVMTAASDNGHTYTCALDSDDKFQIAESGGNNFELNWNTATGNALQVGLSLGWRNADTASVSIHTALDPFKPDKKASIFSIYDFDNSTHKITHKNISVTPAQGDKFEIVRSNCYPPNNVYECFPALIKDELVGLFHTTPLGNGFRMVRRIEGSTGVPHEKGTSIVEVLTNYRMEDDFFGFNAHTAYTRYQQEIKKGIKATKRNPLLWFLELWHSTGEGWNGTYDVLHKEHGAGLPSSLIAATTIATMADKIPTYRLGYTEPVSLANIFIRDICIPCGLYPAIDANGKLSVKRLEQHDSDSTADLTITEGNIIKGSARASQDHVGIVGRIQIEHGWNPADGTFREVFDSGLTDVEYWYPESKPDKHECNIWPLASEPDSNMSAVRKNVLGAHAIRILTRTGFPKVMLSLSVPLSADTLPARPGDLAKVTLDGPCPLPTGTRTLSGEWFEIHAVEIDPLGSSIRLDLFWLGWYRDKFSKWNLGAAATTWHAATKRVTVATTTFQTGEDCTDYVATGDKIRIYYIAATRKDGGVYGDTEELTVNSVSGYVIQFTGAPTNAIVAGDVVACCDYNSATTEQKKRAFLAEDPDATIIGEETVGSAGDNPYVYR